MNILYWINFLLIIIWGSLVYWLCPLFIINSAAVELEGEELGARAIKGLRSLNNVSVVLLIFLNCFWFSRVNSEGVTTMAVLLSVMSATFTFSAIRHYRKQKGLDDGEH